MTSLAAGKKIAFMIVYDDIDYVDYAIRSIKDHVDSLVIIEGAFEITMATGKPPRSSDGTLDVISHHVSSSPNVFSLSANLHEHKDHYDLGYQWAVEHGARWAIMLDSDEVWSHTTPKLIDTFCGRAQEAHEIRVHEYCFINDFWHWYRGSYPRIFRCVRGAKFVYDNEVKFPGFARGGHETLLMPEATRSIYHYAYVRNKKRWQMKQDYMYEKDKNPNLKNYGLGEDAYVIPGDLKILPFAGRHPAVMREHPFYAADKMEIIHGENKE